MKGETSIHASRRSLLSRATRRRGGVLVLFAILLVVLLGCVAMAIDIGYITLARTQLQAAADASALGGGTELLPGLGVQQTKTAAEVDAAVRARAVEYAGLHRGGEQSSVYADGERDVRLGKAVFDPVAGTWNQTWDAAPYNMVRVDLHRWESGTEGNGDAPLPLFFARILGHQTAEVDVHATAVILPTRGFRIIPGSSATANIMPFAFRKDTWFRRRDAQRWFDQQIASGLTAAEIAINPWIEFQGEGDPQDPNDTPIYNRDRPLFYDYQLDSQGELVYVNDTDPDTGLTVQKPRVQRDVLDNYTRTEIAPSQWQVTNGPDQIFEVDMYPEATGNQSLTAGNAGTIDLGSTDNSGSELTRQILYGLNESDWLSMQEQGIADGEGEFTFESGTLNAEGDTGVTASILNALDTIIGEPRTIMLFEEVSDESGNNTVFRLCGFQGVSVVGVQKSGNPKHVWVQPAKVVDETALPDYDREIGEDDSIFTPLILIE